VSLWLITSMGLPVVMTTGRLVVVQLLPHLQWWSSFLAGVPLATVTATWLLHRRASRHGSPS
jgi:hypothetical protein